MNRDELSKTKLVLMASVARLRREAPGEDLGHALRELGEVERKLGNHQRALAHYEESATILRAHGNPLLYAHTIRHLGDVYRKVGRPEQARPCYDEALATYRSHPEAAELDVTNAVRSMALLEHESGNRDVARQLWSEARNSYVALGIDAGVNECSRRLHELNAGRDPR